MEINWKFSSDDPNDTYKLKLYNQAEGMYLVIRGLVEQDALILPCGRDLKYKFKHEYCDMEDEARETHRWYQSEILRLLEENDIDLDL